jgi:hypothetical protein
MNAKCFLALVLLFCGCSTGIEVAEFKPAQQPEGVHMEMKLNGDVIDGNKIEGELLAVRADGVLLNVFGYLDHDNDVRRVVLIPFWMMDTVTLEQMGRAKVESQGEEQNKIYLERLRLVSRFPQGMSDQILRELMDGYSQDKLDTPHKIE